MQKIYVYRSNRKQGTFLFLPEKDNFEAVPDELQALLGELEFSFEFSMDDKRKLIRSSSAEVLKQINKEGYFLQLPPAKFSGLSDQQ